MKVKELLTDESKWTTGSLARDFDGNNCTQKCPDACCWCLIGAIYKCYGFLNSEPILSQVDRYIQQLHKQNPNIPQRIVSFNDNYAKFEDIKNLVETLDI